MELTPKQKKHLRSLGQRLDVSLSVGRGGMSEPLVGTLAKLLDRHELVKVRLSQACPARRAQQADELARRSCSHLVGIVGRTVLLYKPAESLPAEKRIALP